MTTTAIVDYETLQTAIADWLDRDDLDDQIPLFIQLAEAKIRRRVRRKVIRTSLVVSAEATTLPSDCAELRSMYPRTGTPSLDRAIRVVTPEQLIAHRGAMAPTGRPRYASIVDGQLLLAPTPNTSYELEVIYFEKITALSAAATNQVLIDSPDVYLYGALVEAAPYLKDDERVPLWMGMFDKAIDEVNASRQNEEYNASLRPVGLPVVFG